MRIGLPTLRFGNTTGGQRQKTTAQLAEELQALQEEYNQESKQGPEPTSLLRRQETATKMLYTAIELANQRANSSQQP